MKPYLYPEENLRRRALAWAVKLGVNPRLVRIQAMRQKWGSCSSEGTVTLAFDLIDQDEKFQDYVIVHELLHLRFSTHGRVFKALMSAHVPGWRHLAARASHRSKGFLTQGVVDNALVRSHLDLVRRSHGKVA